MFTELNKFLTGHNLLKRLYGRKAKVYSDDRYDLFNHYFLGSEYSLELQKESTEDSYPEALLVAEKFSYSEVLKNKLAEKFFREE